jgi:hypothetical protein
MFAASKKPGEVAAEVIMLRLVHSGSFFLLEGDSDCRFWQPFKHETCEIINAGSKLNVMGAIQILDGKNLRGALGLADSDLDQLESSVPLSKNVVLSAAHDLECLLLQSRALDRILIELADADKLRQLEIEEGWPVRQALINRGLLHGRLRWLASQLGWNPSFQTSLRLDRFLDPKSWRLDEVSMLNIAVTMNCPLSREDLEKALKALPQADPWHICRGHDLVDILCVGLRGKFGRPNRNFGRDAVAQSLRLAADRKDVFREPTVKAIRIWQNRNRPFKILSTGSS